jgi:hypothetical protein
MPGRLDNRRIRKVVPDRPIDSVKSGRMPRLYIPDGTGATELRRVAQSL